LCEFVELGEKIAAPPVVVGAISLGEAVTTTAGRSKMKRCPADASLGQQLMDVVVERFQIASGLK